MFDAVAQILLMLSIGPLETVEHEIDRPITDRMDRQLDVALVCLEHDSLQITPLPHQQPQFIRVIEIWFTDRGRTRADRTIGEDLEWPKLQDVVPEPSPQAECSQLVQVIGSEHQTCTDVQFSRLIERPVCLQHPPIDLRIVDGSDPQAVSDFCRRCDPRSELIGTRLQKLSRRLHGVLLEYPCRFSIHDLVADGIHWKVEDLQRSRIDAIQVPIHPAQEDGVVRRDSVELLLVHVLVAIAPVALIPPRTNHPLVSILAESELLDPCKSLVL